MRGRHVAPPPPEGPPSGWRAAGLVLAAFGAGWLVTEVLLRAVAR